jgi:plasmid stabilization system protein ParE
MSGYILHPEAYTDIDGLWEFIAKDNLDAADRVREEIYETSRASLPFPTRATGGLTSLAARCDS